MQATAQRKVDQQGNKQGSPSQGNGSSQGNSSQANGGSQANGSQANGDSAADGSQAAAAYQPMRIVCMSATRTGQSATARLLGARVYVKVTEREVQLQCHLVRRGRGEGWAGMEACRSCSLFDLLMLVLIRAQAGMCLHTLFLR